jgi:hypothetical protein
MSGTAAIAADDAEALEQLRTAYRLILSQLRRYPTDDPSAAAGYLSEALSHIDDAVKAIKAGA